MGVKHGLQKDKTVLWTEIKLNEEMLNKFTVKRKLQNVVNKLHNSKSLQQRTLERVVERKRIDDRPHPKWTSVGNGNC